VGAAVGIAVGAPVEAAEVVMVVVAVAGVGSEIEAAKEPEPDGPAGAVERVFTIVGNSSVGEKEE
jgi:hypothetical protein